MARYSVPRYGMTTPYEILTPGATTPVRDAAHAMADEDRGPVVVASGVPVGVVTDRDTTGRRVACGQNPLEAVAAETLSAGAVTVSADDVPVA